MMLHPVLEKARIASPRVFKEMIKTNLSHLLDIENGFDWDALDQQSTSADGHHRIQYSTIFGAPLTQEGICTMNQLISFITKPKNIAEVGLFRKCGSAARIRQLQDQLCSGTTYEITSEYNVHDACGLLKQYLRDLPQPVLTNQLRSLFIQTIDDLTDDGKRLDAVRLLLLLLPRANHQFIYELLDMFSSVVSAGDQNRMNASSLATIFAPILLFSPREISSERFKSLMDTGSYTQCMEFMIENFADVFEPPGMLLQDCRGYLDNLARNAAESSAATPATATDFHRTMISTTNLIPTAKFCAQVVTPKDYTQQMLAQLYADAEQMRSSKKAAPALKNVLKRVEKANATPLKLHRDKAQAAIIKSMKKSAKKQQQQHETGFAKSLLKKLRLTPGADRAPMESSSSGGSLMSSSSSGSSNNSLGRMMMRKQSSKVKKESPSPPTKRPVRSSYVISPKAPSPKRPSLTPKICVDQQPTAEMSVKASPCRRSVSMAHHESHHIYHRISLKPMPTPEVDYHPLDSASSSSSLKPPLPPKPTPRTIRKKCSTFSLQEEADVGNRAQQSQQQPLATKQQRNLSTQSLPTTAAPVQSSAAKKHVTGSKSLRSPRSRPRPPQHLVQFRSLPSPLIELSNSKNVHKLRQKYELMSTSGSRIPRLDSGASLLVQDRPDNDDDEDAQENYVCLSSMPRRNYSQRRPQLARVASSPRTRPPPSSGLTKRSSSRRGSKSPRRPSLLPMAEDDQPEPLPRYNGQVLELDSGKQRLRNQDLLHHRSNQRRPRLNLHDDGGALNQTTL